MNFALMFALALGIDYALFIVYRFRGAFFGSEEPVEQAVAETMDTAGKAVLLSGITVLISLTAVMLVPSPAFRSMALGIMLSVIFILAATLTLLPAALAKLGPRVDRLSLPWCTPASTAHRASPPGPSGCGAARWPSALAVAVLVAARAARSRLQDRDAVDQGRARGRRSRVGYTQVQARSARARPARSRSSPQPDAAAVGRRRRPTRASPACMPPSRGANGLALVQAIPNADPSSRRRRDDRPAARALPAGALVGGAVAENHDLERALAPGRRS
jgi:RND superfamily putative drug exporter